MRFGGIEGYLKQDSPNHLTMNHLTGYFPVLQHCVQRTLLSRIAYGNRLTH